MVGFKVISLKLIDNPLLGDGQIEYEFLDSDDLFGSIYTTVIIGPNGTGKSNLFRIIIGLFKELYDLKNGDSRSYDIGGVFELQYLLNERVYSYTNAKRDESSDSGNARLLIDGLDSEFDQVELPISIVANSIMLTDKYPIYSKKNPPKDVSNPTLSKSAPEKVDAFPNYKYLGLRSTPQSASTRSYVRKTVEFVVEESNSLAFRNGLKLATEFLGLQNKLSFYYDTSNTPLFFKGTLTPEKFRAYFEDIRIRYEESPTAPPFKLGTYLRIADDSLLIDALCDFCNFLYDNSRLTRIREGSTQLRLIYDVIDSHSFSNLSNEYVKVELLRQLGILLPPEILLHREKDFHLQDSSSGEYHFFSSVVGLMATVKPHSLVFIDEPEVSLHPNWQMKYLSFIRMLFASPEYATSHLFVATHSHFLVSDLDGRDSKILGLHRIQGFVNIVEFPKSIDTFGWSAEEVLYRIFGVKSSRNFFVEMHLRELLGLISENSQNAVRIQQLLEMLGKIQTSEIDPLNLIIAESKEYLSRL